MQSGGKPKEVRKMVGGIDGERTERKKHREGGKHTKTPNRRDRMRERSNKQTWSHGRRWQRCVHAYCVRLGSVGAARVV